MGRKLCKNQMMDDCLVDVTSDRKYTKFVLNGLVVVMLVTTGYVLDVSVV